MRNEALEQNNFLANRTTKQQETINNLTKEIEGLKEKLTYYKGLLSDMLDTFQKFSDCINEIKKKICKSDNVASENLESETKARALVVI